MTRLDALNDKAVQMFRDAGVESVIEVQRRTSNQIERATFTRKLDAATRYLRITPVVYPSPVWDFEVLGGSYGSRDPRANFDGRRGGDEAHVLKLIELWLIDLAGWEELPVPPGPNPSSSA